jgi:hypothetical protein
MEVGCSPLYAPGGWFGSVRPIFASLLAWGLAFGVAGCSNCGSSGSGSSSTSTASVAATPTSTTPPPRPAVPASDASLGGPANPEDRLLDLQGRFVKEAANRPTGTPRVEDVYGAIAKAGFPLEEQQQHLASPFKASYCVGAKTKPDIALSVCEYPSVEIAQKGKAESEKIKILNRELFLNGATTLTVRLGDENVDSEAAKKKIVEAFSKVQPPPSKK